MEYLKLNNLGNFLDLAALWKAYPRGGKEGDYCNANGYEHFWDKFQNEWISAKDLSSVPSESLPRETTNIYEDLNLHHDLNVAGTIRGKIEFTSDSKGFEQLAEYKAIIERLEKIDITTEDYKTAIDNLKTLAERLKEQAEKALTAAEEAEQYINGVLKEELDGIFTQLDGTVISHFGSYTPTTDNLPASEWVTLKDKEAHLNDTFTNKLDRRSYRWEIVNGDFCWKEIIDPTAAEALAAAARAQDTADGKRKTFTRQPTEADEYEVGDLWLNATYDPLYSNDVLRAVEAKSSGSPFDINHWILSSKYTDDKIANQALGVANQATKDAEALKEMVGKINDDTVLDLAEKAHIRTQWELINGVPSLSIKGFTGSYFDTIELAVNVGYFDSTETSASIVYDGQVITYEGVRATYPCSSSSDLDLAYEALRDFLVSVKLYGSEITEDFERIRMVELFNAYYREEKKLLDRAQKYYSEAQAKDALKNFVNGEYLDDIQTLKRQIDQSAQTHIQSTDPSEDWTEEDVRHTHISDIWWNNSDTEISGVPAGATAIYQSKNGEYYWEVTPVPKSLFDEIDGKARLFVSKPEKYSKNDIWILESEYTLDSVVYPIGTIVIATEDSDTFNVTHWEKKDTYADVGFVSEEMQKVREELDEAVEAAQNAADAAGKLASVASGQAEQALKLADDLQQASDNLLELYTGLADTKVGTDEYNQTVAELVEESSRIEDVANGAQNLANQASNNATSAMQKAVNAQTQAEEAKNTLANWSADNIISPFEKQSVSDELAFIKADKDDIDNQKATYEVNDETALYNAYVTAYNKYKEYLEALTKDNNAIALQSDFGTTQAAFYDARTEFLTAIAIAARGIADLAQEAADAAKTLAEEAQEAAKEALEAADKLQVMLETINDDNTLDIIEKRNIRTQWELINGAETLSAPGADGSYNKALVLAESLGYKSAKNQPVVVTYGGKRITYAGKTATYTYAGVADLELAYETLREYLRSIRLYSNETQPGFSRQEFASILTAYYVAESALINNTQAYYTESQKQIALDEAEKALKAAGVSQEILGVTEDLLESVDEADCILTVIEKNSLKQTYSVISDLTEIFLYGEDDDTVGTEGTGTFHALFAALLEIGSDKTLASANALASRFKGLQTQLISVGNIFGDGSTVVTNNYRSNLYSALGSYLSQEEKSRHDLSRAYTGTVDEAMGNEIAQRLGYADYAEMKVLAESEKLVINGGRLNAALIEAEAITANMIAVNQALINKIDALEATVEKLTVGKLDTAPTASGNKITADGDGIIMYDADGKRKARINSESVGVYDSLMFELNPDYTSSALTKKYAESFYIPQANQATYLNGRDWFFLNLGYCDKGSVLTISSFNVSVTSSSSNQNIALYVNSPNFVLKVYCNNTCIKEISLANSGGTYPAGQTMTRSFTINQTINITQHGSYRIKIQPYGYSGPVVVTSTMYLMSTSGSGSVSMNVSSGLKFKLSRPNYEYTHIGCDGIMQVIGSGFLHSSTSSFAVGRNGNILMVDYRGIHKSTDGGESWETL